MNLLLSSGHGNAWQYPLAMVMDEAALVVERENNRSASSAIMLQAAAASVMSKAGGEYFGKLISRLTGE